MYLHLFTLIVTQGRPTKGHGRYLASGADSDQLEAEAASRCEALAQAFHFC